VDIIAATGNRGKLAEMRRVLSPAGINVFSPSEAGVVWQADETGKTFEENAMIKALAVCRAADMPCFADDSGLEVDALGGAPGIYSARWAGRDATDADRIAKLLDAMKDVPDGRRTARFVCAICCVFPGGRTIYSRGECEGVIARAPRGDGGFGYDPVFIENSTGKTFALLSSDEKDSISHRGRALRDFVQKLAEYI
jgi:XTP/dITP diphosphohydrolase